MAIDEEDDPEPEEKKKKRKDKMANETFIVVRPPPAKSNHPLNLQVQLVPPHVKAPGVSTTPRQSVDEDNELTRTTSNRSDVSAYSDAAASTSSFASTSSTSTSSSRRMIVPLYTLQAHNVLTNIIVDAGTDAKISKFTKRGIEVIELAALEPVEVWALANTQEGSGSRFIQRPSKIGRPVTPVDHPHSTPTSSAISLSSAGMSILDTHAQTSGLPATSDEAGIESGTEGGMTSPRKRNLFGKIFKKKDELTPTTTPTQSPAKSQAAATPTSRPAGAGHGRSLSAASALLTPLTGRRSTSSQRSSLIINPPVVNELGVLDVPVTSGSTPGTAAFASTPNPAAQHYHQPGQPTLLPATLGVQPTLSSLLPFPFPLSSYPPNLRTHVTRLNDPTITIDCLPRGPAMYVWIVRKWFKKEFVEHSSLLSNIGRKSGGLFSPKESAQGADLTSRIEVRLEWKKGKSAKSGKKKRGEKAPPPPPKEKDFAPHLTTDTGRPPSRGASVSSKRASRLGGTTPSESNTSLTLSEAGEKENHQNHQNSLKGKDGKKTNRLSLISAVSGSLNDFVTEHRPGSRDGKDGGLRPGSGPGTPARRHSGNFTAPSVKEEDDGDESDPEDSETPWVCTLKIRRNQDGKKDREDKDNVLKLKTATLSPTPHHPKVVAMLKVPFPLPDVLIGQGESGATLLKRDRPSPPTFGFSPPTSPTSPTTPGTAGHTPSFDDHGMKITAEELKDVISSTGLWLVVREGFGGVGRVSRKGDGWRIRA